MALRASSLQSTNTLAINREIGSQYDVILEVSKHLAEIDTLANEDISGLINSLNDAKDFTGITVVTGETPSWDATNKILTVPVEKGDAGESGRGITSIELISTAGLTKTYAINYTDGTSSTFTVINGANGINGTAGKSTYQLWLDAGNEGTLNDFLAAMRGPVGPIGPVGVGIQGEKGDAGQDLTIEQIVYNSDGTFTWHFSDETTYTTPNLKGPKGDKGDQGVKGDKGTGIHHIKGTSTTDPEGDFGSEGEKDTYTMYADANEEWPLGWFVVQNGSGAYSIALREGYNGAKEQFYNELTNVREYSEDAASAAASTNADKLIVAADKDIVLAAKDETITAKDTAVESANVVQTIFLGAKSVDPTTDNDGSPLITGVMYYNDVLGTLKIWTGTEWTTAAFSANGAVFSFNGRTGAVALANSDITIAVGKNLSDAIKYSESDKVLTDVNKLNLSIDTNLTAGIGQMTWSPDERTVNIGLDNNVVLQTGQEMLALVRNGTVSTITNGTVVMLTGSIGNSGRLVVAPYDGVADASLILGITTEPIAAGADGFVTSYGKVRGIDTSMWADGNVLYVNGSGLSTTPTNTLSMKIAVVVHAHVNGTLMVRVDRYSQVKEW